MCICARSLQPQMPLYSIYSLALEQDQEQSIGLQQAATTLHTQTFIQVHFTEINCNMNSVLGSSELTCKKFNY